MAHGRDVTVALAKRQDRVDRADDPGLRIDGGQSGTATAGSIATSGCVMKISLPAIEPSGKRGQERDGEAA